jgi:hypothetical protein
MSKISLENEYNTQELNHLKKQGYPECNGTPLTADEIKNLKIGTVCYVATLQSTFKMMMFTGNLPNVNEFAFCGYQGVYYYKERNAGKTYNVFLANVNVK